MDVNSIDDELVCDEPLDTSSLSIEIPAESQCSSRAHLFDKYQSPGPSAFSPGSSSFTPNSSASSLGSLALSPCASLLESVVSEHPKVIKLTKKTKQVTLPDVYDRMRKFQHNDYRAKQIDELIAKMICIDFQPISLVDNKGFQELLNHLEPRYTIPSRKTFANKILRDMYTGVSLKIKSELLQAKHIAITTDMWTSIANVDYMAVTAHFYKTEDHTLTLTHKCLEVVPFPEVSHTADNLKNFLVKVLREWEISNKVVAVVRDNGADISAALERSQYEAVSCVAHTLQLVVKDGLMDNPKIKNIIKKAKQIVGSFKHSAKNTKLLKDCQRQLSLPVHRMITDEPTRWNSTLHMLRRLQEQKDAIILLSSKSDVTLAAELTNEDWKTLEYAVDILEMFEVATLQVSKESSCISEVSYKFGLCMLLFSSLKSILYLVS